jgi:hypothetical protein
VAIQAKWYGAGFEAVFNKEIDWDTDAINVALVGAGYTPNQDTHTDYVTDVEPHELATGGGYTHGGQALANKSAVFNDGTNVMRLDADDSVWGPVSTITAAFAVIYHVASGTLLAYTDFGGLFASAGSPFTLQWSADGVLRVTVA